MGNHLGTKHKICRFCWYSGDPNQGATLSGELRLILAEVESYDLPLSINSHTHSSSHIIIIINLYLHT